MPSKTIKNKSVQGRSTSKSTQKSRNKDKKTLKDLKENSGSDFRVLADQY
jgi:hypothetical protein